LKIDEFGGKKLMTIKGLQTSKHPGIVANHA
jgi:hypothetical protein